MLSILYNDHKLPFRKSMDWHVGEKILDNVFEAYPEDKLSRFTIERVICVQADGHELEWIQEHFLNLPMMNSEKHPVCLWYGDTARMIVAALPKRY